MVGGYSILEVINHNNRQLLLLPPSSSVSSQRYSFPENITRFIMFQSKAKQAWSKGP
jgi:hypothetical protein